jgi:hypothetical protein
LKMSSAAKVEGCAGMASKRQSAEETAGEVRTANYSLAILSA